MRQKSIVSPGLAHPSAPVPMASRVGPVLATSGIFGKNPDTGQMPADAEGQAAQCFANLKMLLEAGGLGLDDVVKVTVFLANDQYRTCVNRPWNEHFPDPAHRPARHALVLPLRGGALVQIEALAVARDT